jgi:hypothetical protein
MDDDKKEKRKNQPIMEAKTDGSLSSSERASDQRSGSEQPERTLGV